LSAALADKWSPFGRFWPRAPGASHDRLNGLAAPRVSTVVACPDRAASSNLCRRGCPEPDRAIGVCHDDARRTHRDHSVGVRTLPVLIYEIGHARSCLAHRNEPEVAPDRADIQRGRLWGAQVIDDQVVLALGDDGRPVDVVVTSGRKLARASFTAGPSPPSPDTSPTISDHRLPPDVILPRGRDRSDDAAHGDERPAMDPATISPVSPRRPAQQPAAPWLLGASSCRLRGNRRS
jgi:hypothetical protein